MFNTYYVNNQTPLAIFNGSIRVYGGGATTYAVYNDKVAGILSQQALQPSQASLSKGSVINSNGRVRANVTLTNTSNNPLQNVSLYAVIYESVVFADGTRHNVVRGVTQTTSVVSISAGGSQSYQLQHNSLSYNDKYGVVVILKSGSGQIIQAIKAK